MNIMIEASTVIFSTFKVIGGDSEYMVQAL